MTGTVTVYFSTGFNGFDIPANRSVLELAPKKVYPGLYFTREDIDNPSIKIADTYDNLKNIDYCSYTNDRGETTYYFATPTPLAAGVTLLGLDLDALMTMGGAENLEYTGGWQERGHISKNDDKLFSNCASEAWLPSQPLRVAESGKFGQKTALETNQDIDIVMSSVDLSELGQSGAWTQEVIEGIVQGGDEPAMYFPAVPTVREGSTFSAYDFEDQSFHSYSIPGTGAFFYREGASVIYNGLKKLYSAGQLQLQASYKIPGEYLERSTSEAPNPTYKTGHPGHIDTIKGVHKTITADTMPFEYTVPGYTVKNKKCFTTYRQYVLVNLGSSDTCVKTPEELYSGSNTAPALFLWSDPSSTGKPYARFAYIKDNPILYADAVKGLQWCSSQIMMAGASGSLWNSMSAAFQASALTRQNGMAAMAGSYASEQSALNLEKVNLADFQNTQRGLLSLAPVALGGISGAMGGNVGAALGATRQVLSSGLQMAFDIGMRNQMKGLDTQLLTSQYNEKMAGIENQKAQIQQSINENKIGLLRNNAIVAPTLLFTPEQNLGLYGYNFFALYEVRKSDEDLKSEDEYYQRFGYNGLHRPLTAQCFKERQYYNFVQAYGVNIKSTFGLRVRQKAIAQLNSGVRVWKVLPNASYYDIN